MASLYAQGSPSLGKMAARQAPVEEDAAIARPDLSGAEAATEVAARARTRALDFSIYTRYPAELPAAPLPLGAAGGGVRSGDPRAQCAARSPTETS